MSSSFVKDCSDVSAPGNASSGKTVIIIVNNETGNVSLDGSELQNLLASHTPCHTASHGADGSQVSVVRMGSGATVNLSETAASTVTTTADGAQHVNLTVEGYPSIPVEGQVGGTGNYAELPLDADAFRRLESVLESEEAREILGKPLLDMVANPEQLGPLEDLMDTSLFEGEAQSTGQSGYTVVSSGTAIRKNQSAPKRRSQRQMDKAEREEVEKILAENHKKMQEEREQFSGHQIVVPFPPAAAPTIINLQGECQDGFLVAEDSEMLKGSEEQEVEGTMGKGSDSAPVRGKGRGRVRGRGKGKGEAEKGSPQEVKGRGRGKKMIDGDGEKATRGEETGRGKARGRGRGRAITVVTTTTTSANAHTISDMMQDADGQAVEIAGGVKNCKIIVGKKKSVDSSSNEGKFTVVDGQKEAELDPDSTEAAAESQEQVAKKVVKKAPTTPKVIPQFEPALFSTPDVMQKVVDGSPTQTIMVKGNGKNIKAQKILLVKKQGKKEKVLSQTQQVKEENLDLSEVTEEQEPHESDTTDVNNSEGFKTEEDIKTEAEEETKPSTTLRETGILSSVSKVMKKRDGKSKVIQVKSPTEVREVVVLNSARVGMNKETLVKVIPPKDPPKEEEKTPGKQKVPKKEGKQQVKKISPPTPVPAAAPATEAAAQEGEQDKTDGPKEAGVNEPKKKLVKKFKSDAQKGGDLHKSFEDIVLLRKREEAQRKKEEIQRRREEILMKREAIKKRKEMKELELKGAMVKKEEVTNTPTKETPTKVIKVTNKVAVKREVEDKKKNGMQVTAATPGGKQAPSTPQTTTIKVIRKMVTQTPAASQDESPIRRSNRAIKKKTFGDEMVTYDLKEELAPKAKEEEEEEEEETVVEEMIITQEVEAAEEEEEEEEEDDGEDDDPERLWCICQKPHNNRFMICCDRCEDWFHGSCVGVTKAIGQQMEHEGKEWVCPKCKKTERAMKGVVVLGKKIEGQLSSLSGKLEQPQLSPTKAVKQIIISRPAEVESQGVGKKPADGKKPPDGVKRLGGLSGFTIPKKVNVVHEAITPPKKILSDEKKVTSPHVIKLSQKKGPDGREHVIQPRFWQKVQESAQGVGSLEKSKPKVLVYQKTTGKIISGAEAPSFDELKDWLKEHPDCGILQPGMMNASGTLVTQGAAVTASPNSQKKVIQVAKPTAPLSSPVSQKVTVVKSADGRVIVKTSENLEKEALTKVVNTVTSQPTTKTVIVSTTKASVPLVKEVEEKKEAHQAKKEAPQPKKEATPAKKEAPQAKKEATPAKKEATPAKKEASPPKKEESATPSKTPAKESKKPVKLSPAEKKKADNAEVRNNVKKTLVECLSKRCEETKDEFPNVTDEYIKKLVNDIERELYLHFAKDVGMKYKARYRSILFNTKDSKNSGLFRKILNGTISPSQLAKMTSEELASKELLEWREREEKKELQAIEKHELEMIALGNQYIMKSHKGEIEIDKDEFIKEKEKAADILATLPIDPMTEILDDSTANHNSHIYDLNCKICNGLQEEPSATLQDSKSQKEKLKEKSNKSSKDHKSDEPAKVKDRKDRKSSSDRDRRERKDSSDKDRHRHRSKDHKEKSRDKDKDRDKDRNRDKDKDRDRDRHRSKSKHSDDSKDKPRDREHHKSSSSNISNDKEKDRDKERERRDSRDKRDDKNRRQKDKQRDRRDSKDEKSTSKRRDSEKDDKKDSRKRRHSSSRSEDRKRRESEKENTRHRDSGSCEKQKDEVSTSDDVVFDIGGAERSSSSSSLPDGYTRDAEPSSTVIGSPEDTNMEPASPTSEDEMLNLSQDSVPTLPPTTPIYAPPPPAEAYSPSSPLNSEKSSPQPPLDRDTLTPPPLPEDEMPTAPPLPDYDVPCTPPPPDEYNPQTPPMPGLFGAYKNFYSASPPMERSTTPPLPEPSSTPPLPRPDSPGTPPLPTSGGTTPTQTGASSTPPHTPRGSTPPLPREKSSGSFLGASGYTSSSPTLSECNKNLGRLTPPIGAETLAVPPKSSGPVLITPEPENVWEGIIHMPDVAKFSASAFEVSGKAKFLPNDVPNMIEVVGRIAPDMVWSYIAQMKKSGSKEILVVRFQPANEEEKVSYIALYSYLSSKKRYAVIGNCGKSVKDFYIVPLASHQTIPQVLLPLNGPGFEEQRAHMLIGVIVRAKSKRVFDHTTGNWKVVSGGQTVPPHKISDSDRSCTPPLPTDEDIQEIALAAKEAEDFNLENDLLGYKESKSLKRRAKNAGESSQSKKRRDQSSVSSSPSIGEEPKSPPEDSYVEASLDQESMLAELNRQIEEHKKELSEMQKTIGNDEDEPYSPSHADESPNNEGEQLKLDTSKISIPSNLQEILDNIRDKEAEIKQKEQEIRRRLSLTSDPIVMNYGKYQTYEKKKVKEATTSGKDVDLRPLLQTQTKPNKETKTDTDLRVLKAATEETKTNNTEPVTKQDEDVDLRIRDPRLARAQAAAASTAAAAPSTENSEKGKTLSKMTDEELLAKALEMEDSESSNRQAVPEGGIESQFHPVMPVPPPFIAPGIPGGFIPPGGPMVGSEAMAGPMPPPPMPPVPPPFMAPIGLPPVDMYRPESSRLGGPQGLPGYGSPDAGTHGSSGYSGASGSNRQRYPNQAWEAGQDYSSRGWGHGYPDRDRERDWVRDRDWNRDWDRDRERDRDREMHSSRDPGHSRYQYKGRRHDRKGGRRRDKRDKDKGVTKEPEGDDASYPEIDY